MSKDYDILKKYYGEKFARLCRECFPTLLEDEGRLSGLIMSKFNPSRFLYDDLVRAEAVENFKGYIYSLALKDEPVKRDIDKTPEELFDQEGYILYKCESNEDVLKFKKFYARGEEICTFRDINRIKNYDIFFAIKKNVEEIKRENFKSPRRQDEYGTSVISLQFSKGTKRILSIKNRYNHTVQDPDATFSNDLENIVAGLTDSFRKYYGIELGAVSGGFELPMYAMANDGRFYRYNYEINNVYYCPENIIIMKGEPVRFDKEKYELIDYFIVDREKRRIYQADNFRDGFIEAVGTPIRIDVVKAKDGKGRVIRIINSSNQEIIISTDLYGRITGFVGESLTELPKGFMYYNKVLKHIECPNIEVMGTFALNMNNSLKELVAPKLKHVGRQCLDRVFVLERLEMPLVEEIEDGSFQSIVGVKELRLDNLKKVGDDCFVYCSDLEMLMAPKLESVGYGAFLRVPKLKKCVIKNADVLAFESFGGYGEFVFADDEESVR